MPVVGVEEERGAVLAAGAVAAALLVLDAHGDRDVEVTLEVKREMCDCQRL